MRESGILMPVFALPSRTGVGELGRQAYEFIELLGRNGVKIWQILPLNPVGYGNSPYQPYSSCAGDEIYISLELLCEERLLDKRPEAFLEQERRVRYEEVRAFKEPYLREAFENFESVLQNDLKMAEDYQKFSAQSWVREYGVFQALKQTNEGKCWNEWKEEDKNWPEERRVLSKAEEAEAKYQMFLQYEFFRQWMRVKERPVNRESELWGMCRSMWELTLWTCGRERRISFWIGTEEPCLSRECRQTISALPDSGGAIPFTIGTI